MLFALTKAPQYANLDYMRRLWRRARQGVRLVPRDRSALCRQRPVRAQPGHRRHDPEAVGRAQAQRRSRSSRWCSRRSDAVEGMQAFVFSLPPLPASTGGLPVQMVISSTGGDFRPSSRRWRRSRRRRARAACSSSSTATSPSTSRRSGSTSTAQGQRSRRHDAGDRRHAGAAGRRELRQPLQPRRPLLRGDPAGAAGRPADARRR